MKTTTQRTNYPTFADWQESERLRQFIDAFDYAEGSMDQLEIDYPTGTFTLVVIDTSEDRCTDHGYDTCPDCGNVGVKIEEGYEPCVRFLTCWADVEEWS